MEYAGLVFNQILIMLILMAVGFILKKLNLIPEDGGKAIGSIMIYVVIPTVIVNAFLIEKTNESTIALGWAFLLALISLIVAISISLIAFRKNPCSNFCSTFSNAGFIGIPLVSAVLGSKYVIYVTGIVIFVNILQYTYGQYILNKDHVKIDVRKLFLNPVIIATLIGLIVYFVQPPIPNILRKSISSITALNSPLAMFILGIYLSSVSFKELFTNISGYMVSLFRLVIIPFVTLAILYFIPCDIGVKLSILMVSAAPVGANIVVFSVKNDIDPKNGVISVLLSTMFSVVTIPLFMLVATSIL